MLAQTSAGIRTYNSTPLVGRGYIENRLVLLPNADEVRRDLKAAERGDASAQFNMALRYDGGLGVPQDYAKSVNWLRKAGDQGLAEAQYNLGALYGQGQGVPQRHVEAYAWLNIAAMSGHEGVINNRDYAASFPAPAGLELAQKRSTELNREIQQRLADK